MSFQHLILRFQHQRTSSYTMFFWPKNSVLQGPPVQGIHFWLSVNPNILFVIHPRVPPTSCSSNDDGSNEGICLWPLFRDIVVICMRCLLMHSLHLHSLLWWCPHVCFCSFRQNISWLKYRKEYAILKYLNIWFSQELKG